MPRHLVGVTSTPASIRRVRDFRILVTMTDERCPCRNPRIVASRRWCGPRVCGGDTAADFPDRSGGCDRSRSDRSARTPIIIYRPDGRTASLLVPRRRRPTVTPTACRDSARSQARASRTARCSRRGATGRSPTSSLSRCSASLPRPKTGFDASKTLSSCSSADSAPTRSRHCAASADASTDPDGNACQCFNDSVRHHIGNIGSSSRCRSTSSAAAGVGRTRAVSIDAAQLYGVQWQIATPARAKLMGSRRRFSVPPRGDDGSRSSFSRRRRVALRTSRWPAPSAAGPRSAAASTLPQPLRNACSTSDRQRRGA